jgi:TetR/AcrR family transcriptional regulator
MTLAERRKREKDQRCKSVIDAASRLFCSKGYEKVSMDEIASGAELSKATLYTYFKDKDSIFFAVVNRGTKILDSMIKKEEERLLNSSIKVGAVKNACKRFLIEYPDYARVYFYFRSGIFELSSEVDNADAKEIIEFNKKCCEKMILELKTCMENRIYRSDLNPVVVVALYISIFDSVSSIKPDLKNMLKDNGITVQQFFLEIMDFLDRLIMNSKETNVSTEKMDKYTDEINENARHAFIPETNVAFYVWDKSNF